MKRRGNGRTPLRAALWRRSPRLVKGRASPELSSAPLDERSPSRSVLSLYECDVHVALALEHVPPKEDPEASRHVLRLTGGAVVLVPVPIGELSGRRGAAAEKARMFVHDEMTNVARLRCTFRGVLRHAALSRYRPRDSRL